LTPEETYQFLEPRMEGEPLDKNRRRRVIERVTGFRVTEGEIRK
jgi:hypothetical protein